MSSFRWGNRRRFRRTCGVLCASLLVAFPAAAGPLAEAAKVAEEKAATGDAVGAYETMTEAFADFAMALPFTVKKAVFVTGKPAAYGAYEAKADSTFKTGEPLVTYLELVGLDWKPVEGGKHQANFMVDLAITDAAGQTLASQENFGDFTFTGFVRNQEIFTDLTLDVSGADPGDYVLRYTIKDTIGGNTASVEQPFTLAAQ
ncbi:MAG: hypothetical protein QMD99_15595 [Rhizobiaceae bacterium]|nr:hypothetical protein [Rhizobiaceae bacterium]